jgi:hypothetical protein
MFEKGKRRAAIAAGAAVAAPSAGAREADYTPRPAVAASHAPQATARIVEVRSGGFDWGEAGLGAAGALSLLGLGAGAVVVTRRSRPTVT